MTGEVVPVDVVTGELMNAMPARMTTDEARAAAQWTRDMQRAVLKKDEDYGVIPGTERPTLYKSGAEMLLLAAGLGFDMTRIEDEDYRERRGVTYRCTVMRGTHVRAVCDAYAGYDEYRFKKNNYTAPWNTLLKMAQKRALVGATLNAVAASGLFVADLEDKDQPDAPTTDVDNPACNEDTPAPVSEITTTSGSGTDASARIVARRDALPVNSQKVFNDRMVRAGWDFTRQKDIESATKFLDALADA